MTATSVVAPSSPAASAVEDALRALAKAQRAIQLYLPNNQTRTQAIEFARASFSKIWHHVTVVELEIRESSFLWEERVVYQDLERGTEGLHQIMRQIADEPDGVGDEERLAVRQLHTPGGGVERGEELVLHIGIGGGELVQQR